MKDYSLTEEERKYFVLNYDKNDEVITVNYANGESRSIPNTEKNENILESTMVDQVTKSKAKRDKMLKLRGISISVMLTFAVVSLVATTKLLNLPAIEEIAIGLGVATVANIPMFTELAKCNRILKDMQKNRYFVKNQEVINRGIENTNVLVNSNVQGKEMITINDIDSAYSYNELKRIVENTEIQDRFAFDTFSEDVVQEQAKVRARRK